MSIVKNAKFCFAAKNLAEMPDSNLPEVALFGRSNVGKSTLLNRLTGQRRLARTGATPGQTRGFNFFEVTLGLAGGKSAQLYLVDVPGFGFAKLSKDERSRLNQLMVEYVLGRPNLKTVCLLNDARRDPSEDEFAILELAQRANRDFGLILTKADKLSKNELKKRIDDLSGVYELDRPLLVSGKDTPVHKVWQAILAGG